MAASRGPSTQECYSEARLWDANTTGSSQLIATATCLGNPDPPADFDTTVIATASTNNAGQAAIDVGNKLVTGIRPNFNTAIGSFANSGPVIDNDGNVLAKENAPNSPIRLYSYDLSSPTDIATVSPTTFSELGRLPGISSTGRIVAFYGNWVGAGPGPGIFLSIPQSSGVRTLTRVSGFRKEMPPLPGQTWPISGPNWPNGICDAGEPCYGELGLDATNNPLFLDSFQPDSRIGISHQELGPPGLDGDVLVLCFLATPNGTDNNPAGYFTNQLGIWTLRVTLKSVVVSGVNVIKTFSPRPIPVLQVGDNLDGAGVSALIPLSDPIARALLDSQGNSRQERPGDHQIVFTALNGGSYKTYRATQTDTDEDGLYDHWETTGIDFNNDRVIDLPIHQPCAPNSPPVTACGANPNRKDIFVEIDYMQSSGWSHRPDHKPQGGANSVSALDQVRQAFANAPVSNPVGGNGITLHTGADDALTEAETITLAARRPGPNDDFYDYKFGNSTNICADGRFGTATDRNNSDGNCLNRLKAKSLAFRYAIFANSFFDNMPPPPGDTEPRHPGSSGVAEFTGNDFLVALGRKISGTGPAYDYKKAAEEMKGRFSGTNFDKEWASLQASTFMHELGHSLGLLHGGNDVVNCKPNYISIMNYSRQIDIGGFADGFALTSGIHNGQWVRVSRKIDFSTTALPLLPTLPALSGLLRETDLNERLGVSGPAGERVVFAKSTPTPTPNPSPTTTPSPAPTPTPAPYVSPADGQIDWNGLGISSSPVVADINYLPTHCGRNLPPSPNQVLGGFNDWNNIVFNHRGGSLVFSDGINERLFNWNEPEPSAQQYLDGGLGGPDVDGDSIPNMSDNCVYAPNTNQADSNADGVGNACDFATTALADLALDMTAPVAGVNLNSPFNYQITVSNQGLNSTGGVSFTDQLPAQVTFVSATPSQGNCSGSSNLICNLGTIASGSSATITVRVTPTVRGRITNIAEVTIDAGQSTVTDPNLANNNDGASVDVVDGSATYTISGRVTDVNSIGVVGAFVHYSGENNGTAITDANGNYSFTAVSGGSYTLKPYKFSNISVPESRIILNIESNQVVDFVLTSVPEVAKIADFDGDGKTDVGIFRPSVGEWWYQRSSDAQVVAGQFGTSTDKITPGDFTGDGKTDIAVWRPTTGEWFVLRSEDNSFFAFPFGSNGDIPAPADYDGDGRTDPAVFRPATTTWFISNSGGSGTSFVNFGTSTDKPVVADYDGDSKADIAIWRSGPGEWWGLRSSNNSAFALQFGATTDRPVQGDYTGDGKADIAFWRPADGNWFIIRSEDNAYLAFPFGSSGDVPVPGDYDGDGRQDSAVFRPTGANWFLNRSTAGVTVQQFGLSTDTPIPSVFVP